MTSDAEGLDSRPRFIVDHNVAKLARWLRMMGYDTVVFDQPDDWQMVRIALAENRIIITKDTGVIKRRVITSGRLRALLVTSDDPDEQIKAVVDTFGLDDSRAFTVCIECNVPLGSHRGGKSEGQASAIRVQDSDTIRRVPGLPPRLLERDALAGNDEHARQADRTGGRRQ